MAVEACALEVVTYEACEWMDVTVMVWLAVSVYVLGSVAEDELVAVRVSAYGTALVNVCVTKVG